MCIGSARFTRTMAHSEEYGNGWSAEEIDLEGEIDYSDIEERSADMIIATGRSLQIVLMPGCHFLTNRYAVHQQDP